ncbi:lymphotoxin-alpha [Dunckerocampus dactyliophorus]|uniref:lymphotoxin-alpha n=1 Tax=Dunckerocampus dactyliophorus TaxID=161453 RepID=UPI002405C55E|nr:lymphotoxin-alpha [Dunckerocampus dactyliophorus]
MEQRSRSTSMEESLSQETLQLKRKTRQGASCSLLLLSFFLLSVAVVVAVVAALRGGCPQPPGTQCTVHADSHVSDLRHQRREDEDKNPSALLTAPFGSKTNGKYLLWESKSGNAHCRGGFVYANGSLVAPRKGMYRVFLQITYESKADFRCDAGGVKLANTVWIFRDNYRRDEILLSSVDTVSCSTEQWSKSLYTAALFSLEANSRLRVTSTYAHLIAPKEYLVFFGARLLPE